MCTMTMSIRMPIPITRTSRIPSRRTIRRTRQIGMTKIISCINDTNLDGLLSGNGPKMGYVYHGDAVGYFFGEFTMMTFVVLVFGSELCLEVGLLNVGRYE